VIKYQRCSGLTEEYDDSYHAIKLFFNLDLSSDLISNIFVSISSRFHYSFVQVRGLSCGRGFRF